MNKNLLLEFSPSVADEMDRLISLFNENTMRGFARLYDPETGAFYFSNSGRDYEGFGADLESTVQLLRCVASYGMLDNYGGSLKDALPKNMINKLVDFTINCADPDGYFYHPQWGKDIPVERRGRDLTWANQIFDWFDVKPPYPTAIDMLKAADTSKTTVAVPDYLKSKEEFVKYLEALDFTNKSYHAGNTLNSQSEQIRAAGLCDVVIDFLNANQNSTNGLWHDKADYYGVSGLMKVAGFYNAAGRRLPNFEKAIDSCIESAICDEKPDGLVYIYNPHSAIASLKSCMKKLGDEEAVKYVDNKFRDNLIPLIRAMHDKLLIFRHPDSSFSTNPGRSVCKSMGVPVAIYMEPEGDVNGTSIAIAGCLALLLHNLEKKLKIYDHNDFNEFISILSAQIRPIKKPVPEGRESSPGRW